MSRLISRDSLEKSFQWSSMINNLFLKGITTGDLMSFFPAELEFIVAADWNKS